MTGPVLPESSPKEDGKKLRQLTGQEHGPYFDWPPFEDQKDMQMEWPHGIHEK
jgi:hypothetical protein